MMSIEAVFPVIGGIPMRLITAVDRFAATTGSSVGAGVAPTGRLACAGPVSADCVVQGVGVGAAVAGAADAGADDVVTAAGPLHAVMRSVPIASAQTWRSGAFMSSSRGARAKSRHPVNYAVRPTERGRAGKRPPAGV